MKITVSRTFLRSAAGVFYGPPGFVGTLEFEGVSPTSGTREARWCRFATDHRIRLLELHSDVVILAEFPFCDCSLTE